MKTLLRKRYNEDNKTCINCRVKWWEKGPIQSSWGLASTLLPFWKKRRRQNSRQFQAPQTWSPPGAVPFQNPLSGPRILLSTQWKMEQWSNHLWVLREQKHHNSCLAVCVCFRLFVFNSDYEEGSFLTASEFQWVLASISRWELTCGCPELVVLPPKLQRAGIQQLCAALLNSLIRFISGSAEFPEELYPGISCPLTVVL